MDNDWKSKVVEAIGKGYCTKENEDKQVDSDLCIAIAKEVGEVVWAEKERSLMEGRNQILKAMKILISNFEEDNMSKLSKLNNK